MTHHKELRNLNWKLWTLILVPIFVGLGVWLSPLAFVPVPWPDDSAFYFVAKELFKWPPRWVMLPQAPFEPTYKIFNFNTMPLYPILIGLGRFIGIDGTFLLKLWPLGAWALSGSLLVSVLYRKGLPFLLCLLMGLTFALDPEERWASVLVRPESLIGLFGMALVLGLTFGFPAKFKPTKFWDPIAALLALGAYAHFNAVHLVFPVVFALYSEPKRLFQIGWKTTLYLSPWFLCILFHWDLFVLQMDLQWGRLNVPNAWLGSFGSAISSLFQDLGGPTPWPTIILWASGGMWILIFAAIIWAIIVPLVNYFFPHFLKLNSKSGTHSISLAPAIGWLLGAAWLWHTKPEVWFVYYLHVALWCFTSIAALKLWKMNSHRKAMLVGVPSAWIALIACIFAYVDLLQGNYLNNQYSWHWSTYYNFVNCIDQQLTLLEAKLPPNQPFRVWGPTFPDVTVELSRKHPHWELTRTNDFMNRIDLALQHGWNTEAVVVTETLNWTERNVSEKPEKVPYIHSTWMEWKAYFLHRFTDSPGWKPNRFVCQRGRWQAFIFMIDEPASQKQ